MTTIRRNEVGEEEYRQRSAHQVMIYQERLQKDMQELLARGCNPSDIRCILRKPGCIYGLVVTLEEMSFFLLGLQQSDDFVENGLDIFAVDLHEYPIIVLSVLETWRMAPQELESVYKEHPNLLEKAKTYLAEFQTPV